MCCNTKPTVASGKVGTSQYVLQHKAQTRKPPGVGMAGRTQDLPDANLLVGLENKQRERKTGAGAAVTDITLIITGRGKYTDQ
jgi:hypothetical protein